MKNIQNIIAFFLLTLLSFIIIACSQNPSSSAPTEDLLIQLPQFPQTPSYPRLSRWLIQIESQNLSQSYSTTEQSFYLSLPKNQPAAITATPITFIGQTSEETVFFKPAGTIYPYEWNLGTLALTWECGFAASLMNSIFQSRKETEFSDEYINNFAASFNWKKLQSTILQKTEKIEPDVFYNPWQLDRTLILENLSNGIFSADYLKTKYIISLELADLAIPETSIIISSYIPENQRIEKSGILSVRKNTEEFFILKNQKSPSQKAYALKLICSSTKKVSLQVINLPILLDVYEY